MHWSDSYIGDPYVLGDADCARLIARVRKEIYSLPVPSDVEVDRAASRLGRVVQMGDLVDMYGERTDQPEEGDVVLMMCRARPSHVGVYCEVDNEPCVLHAMENAGMVVRHRLRDLHKVLLTIEGFYKWK